MSISPIAHDQNKILDFTCVVGSTSLVLSTYAIGTC
jgi:hypothetical protein